MELVGYIKYNTIQRLSVNGSCENYRVISPGQRPERLSIQCTYSNILINCTIHLVYVDINK